MRLSADDLIECYRRGVFPMADSRDDPELFLVDPDWRGVLPLDRFRAPRRLARFLRKDPFEVRVDTHFDAVLLACAQARTETWINHEIARLYGELHRRGLAHSVECWRDGALVGGLYGVALGGAFFGESMFSRETDASKAALVALVGRLIAGGFLLLDAQFWSAHLAQFGAVTAPRRVFKRALKAALEAEADFHRLPAEATLSQLLQLTTQTS